MDRPDPRGSGDERLLKTPATPCVIDTDAEKRLDRVIHLARRVFDVPIAAVNLMDSSRIPRKIFFCEHALFQNGSTVIPDARRDPQFKDNPLVKGDPFIRFYAGHPLRAADGVALGMFSIADWRPRRLNGTDLQTLKDLAHLVEDELSVMRLSQGQIGLVTALKDARRKAFTDSLTRTWNRAGILEIFRRELDRANALKTTIGALMIDIDHFKRINDAHGHAVGDAALKECAHRLRMAVRRQDAIGRYGGDEFLILIADCDLRQAIKTATHVSAAVRSGPGLCKGRKVRFTVSCGASASGSTRVHLNALLQEADAALYRAKQDGVANGREMMQWKT